MATDPGFATRAAMCLQTQRVLASHCLCLKRMTAHSLSCLCVSRPLRVSKADHRSLPLSLSLSCLCHQINACVLSGSPLSCSSFFSLSSSPTLNAQRQRIARQPTHEAGALCRIMNLRMKRATARTSILSFTWKHVANSMTGSIRSHLQQVT